MPSYVRNIESTTGCVHGPLAEQYDALYARLCSGGLEPATCSYIQQHIPAKHMQVWTSCIESIEHNKYMLFTLEYCMP